MWKKLEVTCFSEFLGFLCFIIAVILLITLFIDGVREIFEFVKNK
jgi:hypothetical protein